MKTIQEITDLIKRGEVEKAIDEFEELQSFCRKGNKMKEKIKCPKCKKEIRWMYLNFGIRKRFLKCPKCDLIFDEKNPTVQYFSYRCHQD